MSSWASKLRMQGRTSSAIARAACQHIVVASWHAIHCAQVLQQLLDSPDGMHGILGGPMPLLHFGLCKVRFSVGVQGPSLAP